ncbi:Aminopeptidase N [Hypsibius exemplaris]|uniref:Aminopeptidase N n=1 Tax=Hypsibius exemplaris TaxID=2072580 RepID=A0A1W0WYV8_HYPEX|nr:Aminopeptidase N [Hypsibius exemplaris]
MTKREEFEMELDDKPTTKRRKGIRLGPFPLFLLTLVLVSSLATLIIMIVFFVEQGQEITDLSKQRDELQQNLSAYSTIAPAPVVPTSPFSRDSYRLPEDIAPIHYDIYLQVFVPWNQSEVGHTNAFTTAGDVAIDVICKNPTDVIILHVWNLTVQHSRIVVADRLHGDLAVDSSYVDEERNFLIIRLGQRLVKDNLYRISIRFTGLIVEENQGLYQSKYTLPGGEIRYLATSQFQPYKARRVFPCFDEPSFRATFDITLKHDARFTGVYSVRRQISSIPAPGSPGWIETRFERTIRQPSYLLALLVSDFKRDSSPTLDGVDFGVLSRGNALSDTTFAKLVGINMTDHFGQLFNMSYKLYNPKLDMVAVPDFDAGAMENWGLIVYREILMLYRQGVSSAEDKKQVARVVAHELAHQWFGNAVTCSWWSESFLNEGFASFLEIPLVEVARPRWNLGLTFTLSETRVAFDADSYETSLPLYNANVMKHPEIDNMFGRITYQKGAAVLRMIEAFMGKDNFYAALNTYLAERVAAGGMTTYKELLEAFTVKMAALNIPGRKVDFNERFDEWISTSGFPLVTFTAANNVLTMRQERFLLGTVNASSPAAKRAWNIPLTFVVRTATESDADVLARQTEAKPVLWFEKTNATAIYTLPSGYKWILANVRNFGYYRVNYEVSNWDRLIEQLQRAPSAIHVFSRVQLIEDSFSLARKGLLDYSIPIRLIQYLPGAGTVVPAEQEYPPWSAAINGLQYIESMIGDSNNSLKLFAQKVIGRKYSDNFWNSTEVWVEDVNEDYQQLTLRTAIIENACYYDLSTCQAQAVQRLQAWRTANSSTVLIDPHFKDKIFCYGVRGGTLVDYEYLLQQFNLADVHQAKLAILRGLGCSRDRDSITRLLNMTLDFNVVRGQDSSYVLSYASKFPEGHLLTWDFLKTHWHQLPKDKRDSMVTDVCGKFKTTKMLDEVTAFYQSLGTDIAEKQSFLSALARIRSNIEWMTAFAQPVLEALAQGARP